MWINHRIKDKNINRNKIIIIKIKKIDLKNLIIIINNIKLTINQIHYNLIYQMLQNKIMTIKVKKINLD